MHGQQPRSRSGPRPWRGQRAGRGSRVGSRVSQSWFQLHLLFHPRAVAAKPWRGRMRVRCKYTPGAPFMKISVHSSTIDIFTHALGNLSAILEKGVAHATAKKFDSNVLVTSRLAPDMLPLSRQVQIACDLAKNSAARLAGVEPPRFEDNEKTIEELRARI